MTEEKIEFSAIFIEMVSRRLSEKSDLPEYCRDPRLANKSFSELKKLILKKLDTATSLGDVNILSDARVWFNLNWDVGAALFKHLFRQGDRDPKFLKLCRDYFKTVGGPDGEKYLDEFRTELNKEGREDLCQYLEYDSGG